ncbi:ewing's tumor-associated antigen 1 [Hippoglossus hippoglossus]|uniref:ewing's tumor-associated antigen 1 n=1 Tax=Hippoglossus hippoglossus TaxID=8267 RepID=UPI00148E1704|nr:ewing's tumor-associated antigen 1 [Hippoglossus hippoglossus]
MNPRLGLTGLPLRQRSSRLRRSCRAAQRAADPGSDPTRTPDLKTPTRSCRSGGSAVFSGESPHNDSDLQQDIIWDATSPSPSRLSKRGRRHPGGVNISDIVSRIAPERGRPEVTEPTLQQWIGDSAIIPCTPEVQVPKHKKKSPRSNGVDELLKLAKQFDFNMFRQDEEEVEDLHQQSLELLSEDILDFENDDQEDFKPLLHRSCEPAGTDAHVLLDQHTENHLDFLFDGPTQHVSASLSQVSSAQTSQVKPAHVLSSKEASGKSAAVSTTNSHGGAARDEFEDDWENDDLLIDSLVLEMTQNPQKFTAPMHSSTQKPTSDTMYQTAVEKENVRQRTTFKLESNPNFSVRRIQTWTNSKPADADTRSRFSCFSAQSQFLGQTSNSEPQKSWFDQRTSGFSSSASNADPSFPKKPVVLSSLVEPVVVSDVLDEDLDAFFLSDPVWDDPADDDLLCEMCEDLENQIQSSDNMSAKQTPLIRQTSNRRAALQPSNRTWDNRSPQLANQQPLLQKQTGRTLAAVSSSNVTAGVQVNVVKDSFRCTSGSSNLSTAASSRVQSAAAAPLRNANKEQFTFKKPNNPVSTETDEVVGKCSAAEIELKKLRAMEKRRQRLKAAQNLGAPT